MPGKPKGLPKTGGRAKGTQNRATVEARTAIAKFVDANTDRLQGWLDRVAEDNPLAAINAVRDLLEYHVPKLARTEMQNLDKNGKPADATTTVILAPEEAYKRLIDG